MVYICTKDFSDNGLSVLKNEQVELKFLHDRNGIYKVFMVYKNIKFNFYFDKKILNHFTILSKWRDEQLSKIIEKEE